MSLGDDFDKFAAKEKKAKDLDLIRALEARGFRITKDPPTERASASLDLKIKPGGTVKIGLVSDTHIGSRFSQTTALRDFYRYCDDRGAQAFIHGGDILEGHHVHRDAVYEQYAVGLDTQLRAATNLYPKSKNALTHFVDGNHDSWTYENVGITSGALLAEKRPDLKFLGYYSAWVEIGKLRIYVAHGSKGGGAYGKSYKPQRLVEQMSVEERNQTHLAFFGHWHTDLYLGRYQGLFAWSLPCFKAQDRFLRSLGKMPVIGGLMLEVEFDRDMKVWNVRQDFRYYEPRPEDYPGGGG